jgi:hypothetical protein
VGTFVITRVLPKGTTDPTSRARNCAKPTHSCGLGRRMDGLCESTGKINGEPSLRGSNG